MKYTPLEDPIFESIRVAVSESLGISDEVVLASDGLCKNCLSCLNKQKRYSKMGTHIKTYKQNTNYSALNLK